MNVGRVGIWSIELRLADPSEISERAAELDELGWGTLWIPSLGGGDQRTRTCRWSPPSATVRQTERGDWPAMSGSYSTTSSCWPAGTLPEPDGSSTKDRPICRT
ncbi:hypothetical protein ACFPIJ_54410 [Dactylosporangium cerinum]|uniref:Luciferase-like domain-containing protein n=1 Tax=Dactylosporangium cerinum TaxID=1434730 RepID=A0ABV9WDF3_9ACTN